MLKQSIFTRLVAVALVMVAYVYPAETPPRAGLLHLKTESAQGPITPILMLTRDIERMNADARSLIKAVADGDEQMIKDLYNAYHPDPSTKEGKYEIQNTYLHNIWNHLIHSPVYILDHTQQGRPIAGYHLIHLAAERGHAELIHVLGTYGVDMNIATDDGYQWTPLHIAAAEGHGLVVYQLLEAGAVGNVRDAAGLTPLMVAALHGHTSVVRRLSISGRRVDINARREPCFVPGQGQQGGETALFLAAGEGHTQVVAELLLSGANTTIKNDRGLSPFDVARLRKRKALIALLTPVSHSKEAVAVTAEHTDLQRAVIRGDRVDLRKITNRKKFKPAALNEQDQDGFTPLINAVRQDNAAMVAELLAVGCNVFAKGADDKTALQYAEEIAKTKDIMYAFSRPGMVGLLCKAVDAGYTPLHFAAMVDNKTKAHAWIDNGISVDAKAHDEQGTTPLYVAAEHGSFKVFDLLREHGADIRQVLHAARLILIPNLKQAGKTDMVERLENLLAAEQEKSAQVAAQQARAEHTARMMRKFAPLAGKVDSLIVRHAACKAAEVAHETAETTRMARADEESRQIKQTEMSKLACICEEDELELDTDASGAAVAGVSPKKRNKRGGARARAKKAGVASTPTSSLSGGSGGGCGEAHSSREDILPENSLTVAAQRGDNDQVKHLIATSPELVDRRDAQGRMPFHYAAEAGFTDVCEKLLQAGADWDARDRDGNRAFDLMQKTQSLFQLIDLMCIRVKHNYDGCKAYKARRGELSEVKVLEMHKKLHRAVMQPTIEEAEYLLNIKLPSGRRAYDIESKACDNCTPLYMACAIRTSEHPNGNLAMVKFLIARGANIHVRCLDGSTPLFIAARAGLANIVEVLIEKGADVNICNDAGSTPLFEAIRFGNPAIVRMLINAGADVNARLMGDGPTPLMFAIAVRSLAGINILLGNDLQAGDRRPEVHVNAQMSGGYTALHLAASLGYHEVVFVLLGVGADQTIRTDQGHTPLDQLHVDRERTLKYIPGLQEKMRAQMAYLQTATLFSMESVSCDMPPGD